MAFVRVCSTCILVYAFLSCLYTTLLLLSCPFVRGCSTPTLDISKIYTGFLWTRRLFDFAFSGASDGHTSSTSTPTIQALVMQQAAAYKDMGDFLSAFEGAATDPVLYWATVTVSQIEPAQHGPSHWQSLQGASSAEPDWSLGWFEMSTSLFLSKAFAGSMHPMKIFPHFYKASDTFDEDDITITTLVTPNRFEVLRKLALRYEGPLSVTVHIPLPTSASKSSSQTLHNNLIALHALVTNSPGLTARADIHLVLSPFPRAFNAWRNIARLLARTTYMLLLDVDFAVCTDWRASVRRLLRDGESGVARRVREGSAALVLPAFEYVRQAEGRNQDTFPRDRHALLDLVHANRVAPFHASFSAGHNSTDYRRFHSAKPGEIYKVTQYQHAYEPYVVVRRDAAVWCDERFTGYGGNKAACLFEMYLSGISFYVLSDHFLIHQSHAYEEEARRSERKYNRRIQSDFREETCLRYLKRFSDQGILNTARASNAREECKKIKGIGKIVMQLLDGTTNA